MLKGIKVRMALLKEGYKTWEKFPVENSMVNVKPVIDEFREKHAEDITDLVIEQAMKGLVEDNYMEFYDGDENNLIAKITPAGRRHYEEQKKQ